MRDERGAPTLGFFRPQEITKLTIEEDSRQWTTGELARLRQMPLFGKAPEKTLEKLPFRFTYGFNCDNNGCNGHRLSCLDWEIGQSYRKWLGKYGDKWEEKFRLRFEQDMIHRFNTHLFVGTVHQYPQSWIIVGLFYPPKVEPASARDAMTRSPMHHQGSLFDV